HAKPATTIRSDTAAQSPDTATGFRETQISSADSNKVLELLKNNPSIGADGNLSIDEAFTLHGHLFLLVGKGTGTCKFTYLLTYKEGHILKCAELEVNSDADLSWAYYSYKEFDREQDTLFNIRTITEKVKDTTLIEDGHLKGRHTLEDVATVKDTLSVHFSASTLLDPYTPGWPVIWGVSE
ncbi:MAG TPA: hypothetical protein VLD19_10630, partial [Chitinophagaceae bacterium]|nr:hypothetical protein [Chitinophagaceae bacterium]